MEYYEHNDTAHGNTSHYSSYDYYGGNDDYFGNSSNMLGNGSGKGSNKFMDGDYTYEEYFYPGFKFERPIYLVIWEVLVIITALVNALVIVVLLRKHMRNPANVILTSIAISDTLTGLVTLPTYIMVYQRYKSADDYEDTSGGNLTDNAYTHYENPDYGGNYVNPEMTNGSYYGGYGDTEENDELEFYVLSKNLCRGFMLTKFFLSKTFHSMSIFLTLFLAFQRYISVAYPFISGKWFTKRTTLTTCLVIFACSPLLHVYHLVKEKADGGMCEWKLDNCHGDCAFLWIIFSIRHFIPCTLLCVFTALFVCELRKTHTSRTFRSVEQVTRRENENRRITIIVISVVIVFLIPEIPYGVFLLASVIGQHTKAVFDLEKNRAIHAAYELLLVISFHANFYIYTFLNRRFREGLKRTLLIPLRCVGIKARRWMSTSKTTMSQSALSQRRTMNSSNSSRKGSEMITLNTVTAIREGQEHSFQDSCNSNGKSADDHSQMDERLIDRSVVKF